MDVVNISRSRRFLRERPIHVTLFDRPRMVVDLLCLEPEQEESRRAFDRSDSLLVITEGEGRLRVGAQVEALQSMDAVLVPPGVEFVLSNSGTGQLTAIVILTPKPTRADEVRVPGDRRPFRTVRPDPEEGEGSNREQRPRPFSGVERPARPPVRNPIGTRRTGGPYRAGPPPERRPYPRRDEGARRPEGEGRPPYPRRDDSVDQPPRRNEGPRRPDSGGRPSYPRRNDSGGRPPYPRSDDAAPADRGGPRRGTTGARAPRQNEGEGPVWFPKGKPAWRPRGAPPAANGGRASSARPQGAGPRRGPAGRPSSAGGSRDAGAGSDRSRPGGSGAGAPRGRTGSYGTAGGVRGGRPGGYKPGGAPRGGAGAGDKKTGDARRASRGQGPLSGHRGPGRSGPRTSAPRRSPE